MKYTISVERFSIGWQWEVNDGFSYYSGFALTKRGAIWFANRMAKRWTKDRLNSLTKESWEVQL